MAGKILLPLENNQLSPINFKGYDMKTIYQTFDPTVLGAVTFINTQYAANTDTEFDSTGVILNVHNVGAFSCLQTIFSNDGTAPIYDIEVNLGYYKQTAKGTDGKRGSMQIDPNGWAPIPQTIITNNLSSEVVVPFNNVFFAIRINIKTVGTATEGIFKLLQQGII